MGMPVGKIFGALHLHSSEHGVHQVRILHPPAVGCPQRILGGAILYLHVFDWPTNGELLVPGLTNALLQTYLLGDLAPLKVRQENSGVVVSLPPQAPDEMD